MEMASGLLSLKWNNHKSTFFHVLSSIRVKESYCDATIACDGNFYPVHKLILSTCSEYFEQIFERTQCKHPVIVLKDIKSDDLEALMNYMYVGEVNVLQEKLGGLIKAAECLKIKGLAVPDEDATDPGDKRTNEHKSPSPKRRKRDTPSNTLSEHDQVQIAELENNESISSRGVEVNVSEFENQSKRESSSLPKRRGDMSHPSSSRKSDNEIGPNTMDVKTEPPDIEEEVIDIKEPITTNLQYSSDRNENSLIRSNVEDGEFTDPSSNPRLEGDEAMPSTSADYQGNSFSGWEGEGSLSNFPNESYTDENSDQGHMICWEKQERSPFQNRRSSLSSLPETPFVSIEEMVDSPERNVNSPRDFRCQFCSKNFASVSALRSHILIHTGQKPFGCPKCPYRANQKGNLAIHMRTHTGERPYRCHFCQFSSCNSSNLKAHVFSKHGSQIPRNM